MYEVVMYTNENTIIQTWASIDIYCGSFTHSPSPPPPLPPPLQVFLGIGQFIVVVLASVLIGIVVGMLAAFTTRFSEHVHGKMTPCFISLGRSAGSTKERLTPHTPVDPHCSQVETQTKSLFGMHIFGMAVCYTHGKLAVLCVCITDRPHR